MSTRPESRVHRISRSDWERAETGAHPGRRRRGVRLRDQRGRSRLLRPQGRVRFSRCARPLLDAGDHPARHGPTGALWPPLRRSRRRASTSRRCSTGRSSVRSSGSSGSTSSTPPVISRSGSRSGANGGVAHHRAPRRLRGQGATEPCSSGASAPNWTTAAKNSATRFAKPSSRRFRSCWWLAIRKWRMGPSLRADAVEAGGAKTPSPWTTSSRTSRAAIGERRHAL